MIMKEMSARLLVSISIRLNEIGVKIVCEFNARMRLIWLNDWRKSAYN